MIPETRTFAEEYTRIVDFHLKPGDKQRRIGRASSVRQCRYCGLDERGTTFNQTTAHAIPELVGNRILISMDECDQCNKHFGETIEDDLGKYLLPLRVASSLKGKSGFPSTKDRLSDIRSQDSRVQITPNAEDALEIDRVNQIITIRATRQPYTPLGVFKCLVKMGLAILPDDELMHCSSAAAALREPIDSQRKPFDVPALAYVTFFPGLSRKNIFLQIWKRRSDNSRRPCLIFFIFFHNVSFQIALPCIHGLGDGNNQIDFCFFDNRDLLKNSDEVDTPSVEVIDLTTPTIIAGEVATLHMGYKERFDYGSRG